VNPIAYRNEQARKLPAETGVYVLCDLDETPIYVGQSVDGIRARVRRHLTSARSDVAAAPYQCSQRRNSKPTA